MILKVELTHEIIPSLGGCVEDSYCVEIEGKYIGCGKTVLLAMVDAMCRISGKFEDMLENEENG